MEHEKLVPLVPLVPLHIDRFARILWNRKTQKNPKLVSILSQIDPVDGLGPVGL
jgi:hypothetical protein